MGPLQIYRRHLQEPGFSPDPAQETAVGRLEDLYQRLRDNPPHRRAAFGSWLRKRPKAPPRGLYLWGGVGRGKTFLMDIFHESLPIDAKLRVHFHRFMHRVHQDLKRRSGQKNPLRAVAAGLADQARVLCFDEFFVSDITDAMILAGLLEELFERGVTLVVTSNIIPDDLYRDGLQRQRFLPAIDLLKRHLEVVNVDGGVDYRLRVLSQAELYHWPLDERAEVGLAQSFAQLAPEPGMADQVLEIEGREIQTRFLADDVAWFDFDQLCEGPRSQNDYLELAREFHAVLLGSVPTLDAWRDDSARRFINLVDVFYDRNVKLVLAAQAPLEALYTGHRLQFEFSRTQSRLLEMQSHEYLARPHKP